MSDLVDRYLEDTEWKEVEKDEYVRTTDEVIATEALGTCLGLAGYDSRNNQAYLLHASTIQNDDLEEQVEIMVDELKEIKEPIEVLAGGTMSSQYNPLSDENFTGYARNVVEDALQSRDIDYRAVWNDPPQFNRLVVSPDYGILYDITE